MKQRAKKFKQKGVGVDGETQWPFSPVQKHFEKSLMQSLENDHSQCRKVVSSFYLHRLFTVLYFSVRSSRSSDLRYGLPSSMSVKTT